MHDSDMFPGYTDGRRVWVDPGTVTDLRACLDGNGEGEANAEARADLDAAPDADGLVALPGWSVALVPASAVCKASGCTCCSHYRGGVECRHIDCEMCTECPPPVDRPARYVVPVGGGLAWYCAPCVAAILTNCAEDDDGMNGPEAFHAAGAATTPAGTCCERCGVAL